jgi:hypothetical protein
MVDRMTDNAQADDGWIEWNGGDSPVPFGTVVQWRLRSGKVSAPFPDVHLGWRHMPDYYPESDVVAYRVVPQ